MSQEKDPGKPFSYTFRTRGPRPEEVAGEAAIDENLLSIRQTLLLLTGGCQISERGDGYYCDKHGRQVEGGQERCGYVAERFVTGNAEGRSKAELQRYINEILGVKDPKFIRRLAGDGK